MKTEKANELKEKTTTDHILKRTLWIQKYVHNSFIKRNLCPIYHTFKHRKKTKTFSTKESISGKFSLQELVSAKSNTTNASSDEEDSMEMKMGL